MIIFGTGSGKIKSFELDGDNCDYCKTESKQQVSVFSRYFDIFWIPVFPIGKKAVAECTHCKKTISQNEFSPTLRANLQKQKIKTPLKHWFLSLLVGIPIAIMIFISVIAAAIGLINGDSSSEGSSSSIDYRKELLKTDMDAMVKNPSKDDSITFRIKEVFKQSIDHQYEKNLKYFSKIKEDKILVLLKDPSLKKMKKKERIEDIKVIEKALNSMPSLVGKKQYIGVRGKYSMMLLKTPEVEKNSKLLSKDPLYKFYGD